MSFFNKYPTRFWTIQCRQQACAEFTDTLLGLNLYELVKACDNRG